MAEIPDHPAPEGEPDADASPNKATPWGVPRVISLIVLLGVVLLVTVLFFRVMAGFLAPMFLAAVLAVVFKPVHEWMRRKMPGHPRLAALGVTTLVSLMVVIPTVYFGWRAFVETKNVVEAVSNKDFREGIADRLSQLTQETEGWVRRNLYEDFSLQEAADLKKNVGDFLVEAAGGVVGLGLLSLQALLSAAIGLTIMIFALYYFFADGPGMIEAVMRLSPLDDEYERELLDQFAGVSRAVVLATILSAIVQGLLGGVGYAVAFAWAQPSADAAAAVDAVVGRPAEADDHGAPVFLLTVLTMVLAIVPFLGATAVWVPVSAWLMFVDPEGFWPGVGLAVYGFAIVSSIDNVIKPLVLHGQSNLHPLLSLLSILGGIQLLGPVGILVGPMLVAFLQTLLLMLRKELDGFGENDSDSSRSAMPA